MNAADKLDGNVWRFAKFAAFLCFALAGAILIASLVKSNSTHIGLELTPQSLSFSQPAFSPKG